MKPVKVAKHSKGWFLGRIGRQITRNESVDLFSPAITIASKHHAMALYLTQKEKGYKYSEI